MHGTGQGPAPRRRTDRRRRVVQRTELVDLARAEPGGQQTRSRGRRCGAGGECATLLLFSRLKPRCHRRFGGAATLSNSTPDVLRGPPERLGAGAARNRPRPRHRCRSRLRGAPQRPSTAVRSVVVTPLWSASRAPISGVFAICRGVILRPARSWPTRPSSVPIAQLNVVPLAGSLVVVTETGLACGQRVVERDTGCTPGGGSSRPAWYVTLSPIAAGPHSPSSRAGRRRGRTRRRQNPNGDLLFWSRSQRRSERALFPATRQRYQRDLRSA